jgi:hypothetical protein
MRDLARGTFSFLLFIFLLVGCAHNIYHFQKINEHNSYSYNRYNPSHNRAETPTVEYGEIEDPLENEVVITPNHETLTEEEENRSNEEYYGY